MAFSRPLRPSIKHQISPRIYHFRERPLYVSWNGQLRVTQRLKISFNYGNTRVCRKIKAPDGCPQW